MITLFLNKNCNVYLKVIKATLNAKGKLLEVSCFQTILVLFHVFKL